MNLLAALLRDHPAVADLMAGAERLSLEQLVGGLAGRGELPFELDPERVKDLVAAEPLGPWLAESYVTVLERSHWRDRVEPAEGTESVPAHEWVTFVADPESSLGIALPDDDSGTAWRVSLFVQVQDRVRRVSIEYGGELGRPVGLGMSLPTGCSLPDWGVCSTDECGGGCGLRRIRGERDGWICHCPGDA